VTVTTLLASAEEQNGKGMFLFLDFETYYDDQYSLRKISIPEYILDPRFEVQMCATRLDNGEDCIVDGPSFGKFIKNIDPDTTTVVAFNALFDCSILAWRYGFVPSAMIDTMALARATRGHLLQSASLESVSRVLGLGAKGGGLIKVKGMKLAQIKAAGLYPMFADYAKQDNFLNAAIFKTLISELPQSERRLMDMVLRCTITPQFQIDKRLLAQHIIELQNHKANLLAECGVTLAQLMSADKFKEVLEARGVDIQYKTTPTGRSAPAFAKTDAFMAELEAHDDPIVQALAAARLGHKSTLEETRARKLLAISKLRWPTAGTMPIPLRYGGAHTHRLSGDWGMNMQNLPSSRTAGSKLRKALIAPPGHKVVTCDLGQIEARLVAWFCGADVLLKQFANKLDPYAKLGEEIFGYPIDRKVQKVEGFVGKTGILGLGFGCGKDKFFNMVKMQSRTMGLDLGSVWTEKLAERSVNTYRETHAQIPQMWRSLGRVLGEQWVGKKGLVTGL
jgi:DNA polymerase I-like protein with 3'-5' exonuclease and polymerase domains